MEAALVALLNQTVQVAAPTSKDLYGKHTYGSDVAHAARVSPGGTALFRTPDGKDNPIKAIVHMDGNVTVTTETRVTLPDSTTPVIFEVQHTVDDDGTDYATKVICG